MKKVFVYTLLLVIFLFAVTGCSRFFKPTYPRNEVPDAIKNICRKEYNINEKLDVKIKGKTLGARLHLDGLMNMSMQLQEDKLDKIQKLLRVIRRVCLSTDANLDYYVIIGYDETLGIEVVFYSYITDLQKAVAGWMSPEDYSLRLVKNMQLNTLKWGNQRIKKFVDALENGNMVKVIAGNLSKRTKLNNLDPHFLKLLTDLNKKDFIKYDLIRQYSTAVSPQKRLFYVQAKEYYNTNPEQETNVSYPSGTVHKLYLMISIEGLNPVIESIYTEKTLPKEYKDLPPPHKWSETEFFVPDFKFHEFLSNQIIQRIQYEIHNNEQQEKLEEFSVEGNFILNNNLDTKIELQDPSRNVYELTFTPKSNSAEKQNIPEKIFDICKENIKKVCNKYKFYDIGKIKFQDSNGNSILILDKPKLFLK